VSTNSPREGSHRGRPRDARLRQRILAAAAELVTSDGIDVGFDRIARAAGASRTTLYRWWSNPHELLLDALLEAVQFSIETEGPGSAIEKLRAQVAMAGQVLSDPVTGGPLRALAAGALADEDTRRRFQEHWLTPRRDAARLLVIQGIAEGSILERDPDFVVDVLFAPIYHRVYFTGGPVDEGLFDELIRLIAAPSQ
jgi:AcrR family transcriptional regulator